MSRRSNRRVNKLPGIPASGTSEDHASVEVERAHDGEIPFTCPKTGDTTPIRYWLPDNAERCTASTATEGVAHG